MRDGVGVADIDGPVWQDRAEESADDPHGLVRPSDVAIADVEYHQGMDLRRQARRRGRELQHRVLARRHGCQSSRCVAAREQKKTQAGGVGFLPSQERAEAEEENPGSALFRFVVHKASPELDFMGHSPDVIWARLPLGFSALPRPFYGLRFFGSLGLA